MPITIEGTVLSTETGAPVTPVLKRRVVLPPNSLEAAYARFLAKLANPAAASADGTCPRCGRSELEPCPQRACPHGRAASYPKELASRGHPIPRRPDWEPYPLAKTGPG